ncbi:MAG: hypothetical protein MR024_02345 [Firmicutes bacterium]|nr:hypothetical protein [Bacillota bacterium]
MKKRVFSFLLAIIMAFMPVFFAGCEIDDSEGGGSVGGIGGSGGSGGSRPGQASFYKEFLDGFKVVYSKSQIGQSADIELIQNEFFLDMLSTLDGYYGSGLENENLATFFPDSIRQTIYQDSAGNAKLGDNSTIINDKWLWTLNPNSKTTLSDVEQAFKNNDYDDIKKLFKGSEYPQLSSSNYYSTPLQIVLYETLLGYSQNGTDNRTMFEVEFVDNIIEPIKILSTSYETHKCVFEIKITKCNNQSINNSVIYRAINLYYIDRNEQKPIDLPEELEKELITEIPSSVNNYLNSLKETYSSTATYSGLTKTDADSLITYILNNVIGADVVKNDYVQFGPDQTTFVKDGNYYNYRNYVGRVAAMVYDFVYDGSEEFVYTYNQNSLDIKFDYIEYYKSVHGGELPSANLDDFQMRPQTAAFLRDYDTDMFFSNADAFDIFGDSNSEAHSFDNSPMSEYQSVVIMPKKEMTLSGIWMQIFSPNPDLAIKVYIRYYAYDPTTGTGKLFTWEQDKIDFYQSEPYDLAYANKDCKYHKYVEGKGYLYKTTEKDNNGNKIEGYYTDFEVGCSVEDVPEQFVELYDRNDPNALQLDAIKLDKFNNSSSDPKLKAEGSPVNGIVESQLNSAYAYKVVPSKNGFGGVTVLDERKVNFSFYEMVFDIEKDISFASQNYDYKLSVVTPV